MKFATKLKIALRGHHFHVEWYSGKADSEGNAVSTFVRNGKLVFNKDEMLMFIWTTNLDFNILTPSSLWYTHNTVTHITIFEFADTSAIAFLCESK